MEHLFLEKSRGKSTSFSHGFTLIEVIASLVLLGILVSVAGFGLVRVVEGYAFSRENQEMTQKAQLAMARMTREIVELLRIETATGSSVVLENREGLRSFGLHDGAIKVAVDSADYGGGDILVEGVSAFTLTWHSGSDSWTDEAAIETLSMVDIELRLRRSDGMTMVFSGRAAPRNNKNIGGASPATPPPIAPSYNLCMIASLKEGDVGMQRLFPLWLFLGLGMLGTGGWFCIRRRNRVCRENGSILIGLIVTLVVISALTAAVLPMFTASTMNQVFSDQGRKAFFLAESGFRYAASRFLNAGVEAARLSAIEDMHGKTYTLADNRGAFSLAFEPYWFKTQSVLTGATAVTVKVPGSVPTELVRNVLPGGRILIGNTFYAYTGGSGANGELGSTLVFSGLTPSLTTQAGTDVRLGSRVGSSQNLSKNGTLTLHANDAWAFPALNGNFTLRNSGAAGITASTIFNYERKIGNTLTRVSISDPIANGAWTSSLGLAAATEVVLEPYLRVRSTGIAGGAERTVAYSVPVGWIAGGDEFKRESYHDTFASGANWWVNESLGGHTVASGAMQVTGMVAPGQTQSGLLNWLGGILGWIQDHGRWAAVAFNWGNVNTNLAQSWMDHRGSLSYDLQVKVRNTQPYFMAGLGFRMRNNSNNTDLHTYGLSFIRQRETRSRIRVFGIYGEWSSWDSDDNIHPDLRPFSLGSNVTSGETIQSAGWLLGTEIQARYSLPAVLLWQRTGPATGTGTFQRIAHRDISGDPAVAGTGTALRLKDWSTLMVRVLEGWELTFDQGTLTAGRHLKAGDLVQNSDGSKTARVMGTPVLASGAWSGGTAAGRLLLAQMDGSPFVGGEQLYFKGESTHPRVRALSQGGSKVNWVMAYMTDHRTSLGSGNTVQTDTTRRGNPRDQANWPPDDWTDRAAGNDYFTLIKWTGTPGGGASFVQATAGSELENAVIRTNALLSPVWTEESTALGFVTSNGDHISLITSSSAGTSTFYDDFAIQLDQKAGTGFLPPIQQ